MGRGFMRRPPGRRGSPGSGEECSPTMTPATPVSRRCRRPSRSVVPPATRMSASWRRTSDRAARVRGSPVGQHEPADAEADELADQRLDRGWSRSAPRERGDRSGRESSPTASQSPAIAGSPQCVGPVRDAVDSTTRVAPAANARRMASGRPGRRRAAAGRRPGRPPHRRPRGCPGCPPAPSKSTRWISGAPALTRRSTIRSGRWWGAPTPVEAPASRRSASGRPEVDGGDDAHAVRRPRQPAGAGGS